MCVLESINESSNRTNNYLIPLIKAGLEEVETNGTYIQFIWVPSRIAGNEKADQLAKRAIRQSIEPNFKVPYSDLCAVIKQRITDNFYRHLEITADIKGIYFFTLIFQKSLKPWGFHPQQFLALYRATFRISIEYGCQVLQLRNNQSIFLKLQRLQYKALRIAGGYRASTPINILFAELKEAPLNIRFSYSDHSHGVCGVKRKGDKHANYNLGSRILSPSLSIFSAFYFYPCQSSRLQLFEPTLLPVVYVLR
ncbi:hypothetical protein ALC57_09859 [Trachymyrmex cornetzi]|uniref:Uncharacterized protein n=1 Tax=Trachymyrmex cornetzi TaxID=471704 RepID=A0A151J532_9HYME|nr:hypothetical protein ALC57_09859 [Trachymyrmex cornetzi]